MLDQSQIESILVKMWVAELSQSKQSVGTTCEVLAGIIFGIFIRSDMGNCPKYFFIHLYLLIILAFWQLWQVYLLN